MPMIETPEAPEFKKALEAVAPDGANKKINLDDFNSLIVSLDCTVRMFKNFSAAAAVSSTEIDAVFSAFADTVLLYCAKMEKAIYGEDEIYI